MIAPDANLLIYCYDTAAREHARSRAWLEALLSSDEPVGLPMLSVYAFLRVLTHPKLLRSPVTFDQAAAIVDSWLALPQVQILYPGDRHWQLFTQVCRQAHTRGPQTTDAVIAAIALEYGAIIHTNDRDFARFPGLRWHNPLAST